jgi:type II secretory pathway component PulF
MLIRVGPVRALKDAIVVRGPIVARFATRIYTCQMLRTLGHLLDSRVPMIEALEVTRATFTNRHFRRLIHGIADHVAQGGQFSRPFADVPFVPDSVKEMIRTGEETGNLSTVMLRLAEYYDTEVSQDLKKAAALLEPCMLIVMGSVVGLIVASVILPLFKLAAAIH